jgi:NAD(P)-dependent dehydrogenase (short-subunit alcohol dehydrogenase family)
VGRRILVVGGGQNDHGEPDPPIGNGRAMAVLFAREGAHIAVADRDRASAEATSGWTGAIIALARSGRSCSQVAMFGRLSGDAALWLHG